jgi:hypothetical protein
MANNYECNDCKKQFSGDNYTNSCPNCGSDSITPIISSSIPTKIINYFKENKTVGILLSVLILIIIILLLKNCNGGNNKSNSSAKDYKLKFEQKDNFIKIVISSRKKDSKDLFAIENPNGNPIFTQFSANQNINITISNGKIYPYKEGDVKIGWYNEFYKNSKYLWKQKEKIITFSFKNGAKADTNYCKKPVKIKVMQKDNCELEIKSNWDTLYPNEVLMTSITGKKGSYENKKKYTFKPKDNLEYDVWYFYKSENDTSFVQGGNGNCNCFEKLNLEKAKRSVINICNKYGNKPSNMDYLDTLKQKIKLYHITLKFNKNTIDIKKISNDFKVEYDNDGTTYNADVTMTGSNYKNIKGVINFIEK